MKESNIHAINYAIGILKQLNKDKGFEAVEKAINGLELVLKTESCTEED